MNEYWMIVDNRNLFLWISVSKNILGSVTPLPCKAWQDKAMLSQLSVTCNSSTIICLGYGSNYGILTSHSSTAWFRSRIKRNPCSDCCRHQTVLRVVRSQHLYIHVSVSAGATEHIPLAYSLWLGPVSIGKVVTRWYLKLQRIGIQYLFWTGQLLAITLKLPLIPSYNRL